MYFFFNIFNLFSTSFNSLINYKINLYNNIYISLLKKNKKILKNHINFLKIDSINNKFLKKKKTKNNLLLNFFNNYFFIFLNFFLKKKIFFSIKKLNYLVINFKNNKIIKNMSKKLKKYYNFAGGYFFFKEFLDILWLSFLLKDGKLFLNWFSFFMEKIYLKNHKKFLNLLKLILTRYYNFFFIFFNILGVFFDIRGKLGVTGNAKKRHFKINTGTYSSTRKNLKINFNQTIVRTSTGVLGVTFCIFF